MLSCNESCLRWPLERFKFSEIGGPVSKSFHDEPTAGDCDSFLFCDALAAMHLLQIC